MWMGQGLYIYYFINFDHTKPRNHNKVNQYAFKIFKLETVAFTPQLEFDQETKEKKKTCF